MSKVPNTNDLYGDDHPTIGKAIEALTFSEHLRQVS